MSCCPGSTVPLSPGWSSVEGLRVFRELLYTRAYKGSSRFGLKPSTTLHQPLHSRTPPGSDTGSSGRQSRIPSQYRPCFVSCR